MFFELLNTAFVDAVVIQTPFAFYDLLEYAIFAILALTGIFIVRKTKSKPVKLTGLLMIITGTGCLCWLIGWQIYIRLFLL